MTNRNINYYWHSEFKNAYKTLEIMLYTVDTPPFDKEVMTSAIAGDFKVRMIILKAEIDECQRKGEMRGRYGEFATRIYNVIGMNN